jgi:hypothetical protein
MHGPLTLLPLETDLMFTGVTRLWGNYQVVAEPALSRLRNYSDTKVIGGAQVRNPDSTRPPNLLRLVFEGGVLSTSGALENRRVSRCKHALRCIRLVERFHRSRIPAKIPFPLRSLIGLHLNESFVHPAGLPWGSMA